jgi:hypothetical protein
MSTRFERDLFRARAAYNNASQRLARATADWHAAAVPLDSPEPGVPPWTLEQTELAERLAKAWAELVACRRDWDSILREIGYQR